MNDSNSVPSNQPPSTVPASWQVAVSCFRDEERAISFGRLVSAYVTEFGRCFDLSGLDGVTVAGDYPQALLSLDRGYETHNALIPSSEFAQGVAMTPAVIRNGEIKSHIVLNAAFLVPLEDEAHDDWAQAVHTLAHECAHVEVTKVFNVSFPETLLKPVAGDMWDALRWQIIEACWEEYAASWLAAPFGHDPTDGYEQTFLDVLAGTEAKADAAIIAYRIHGDHARVAQEVYGAYGNLLKFASYQFGNLAGRGRNLADLPRTRAVLATHWFVPYCAQLEAALVAVRDDYGRWRNKAAFEKVGDIADSLVRSKGLSMQRRANGFVYVDVPYTAKTMPFAATS